MDISILTSLIASLVASIGAFASARQSKKAEEEARHKAAPTVRWTTLEQAASALVERSITPMMGSESRTGNTAPSGEQNTEYEKALRDLEGRIAGIENRFPDASTIDKIASINDAVLATKVEELQKGMERIEKRLDDEKITKWDVATIVFAVLASIGGVVAITFGVINLVTR